MENKKMKNLSFIALIISILPLATFIPTMFHITLKDGIQNIWGGINIVFVLVSLMLSLITVKNKESRSVVNILSMTISAFWTLIMLGAIVLAFIINIM